MNIFKEIRSGINEMDTIQEQLTPREKATAIISTIFILGYMLLGAVEGFVWATVCYTILIVLCINIFMFFLAIRETYYVVKNILNNMEGMW